MTIPYELTALCCERADDYTAVLAGNMEQLPPSIPPGGSGEEGSNTVFSSFVHSTELAQGPA